MIGDDRLLDALVEGLPLVDRAWELLEPALRARVAGRRLAVVGGAGTIGGATVRALLALRPAALTVLDRDENALAELARDARIAFARELRDTRLTLLPLDAGSALAARALAEAAPFDALLNFAALKHVRSEKSVTSALAMAATNVLLTERLVAAARETGCRSVFSVSTDKAASPVSVLGATKRWMEGVLAAAGGDLSTSTCRFANVAFSSGSLPDGFVRRLRAGQPLYGPSDVARYFVTRAQSARLCLIAWAHPRPASLLVPEPVPDDALTFVEVARRLLARHGLEPEPLADTADPAQAVEAARQRGRWPCAFSPTVTPGEKALEVFVAPDELTAPGPAAGLAYVTGGASADWRGEPLATLESFVTGRTPCDWPDLMQLFARTVPGFAHAQGTGSLDDRP